MASFTLAFMRSAASLGWRLNVELPLHSFTATVTISGISSEALLHMPESPLINIEGTPFDAA